MRLAHIPTRPKRPGFTLIEILVVIAIIAVLTALVGAGIMVWIPVQQGRNTQGTIRTVKKIFDGQWTYVVEQAKKETPSPYVINTVAGGNQRLAQAIWIKIRLVEAFPMSYDEVNNPNNPAYIALNTCMPASQRKSWETYRKYLGVNRMSSGPAPSESSACLLMALSVSRGGSVLSPDELGSFIVDTDNDGVKEIVDGWRTPLVMYRFAWGSAAIPGNPAAPNGILGLNPAFGTSSRSAKLADPLDPDGLLLTWQQPARVLYETYAHRISTAGPGSTQPPTFYVIPVLVSLGPDQDMMKGAPAPSLPSPTLCPTAGLTVQNPTTAGDNIYSFNLKGN